MSAFDNALEVNKRCTFKTIVFSGIYIAPMSRVSIAPSEYGGFTEESKYNSLAGGEGIGYLGVITGLRSLRSL